MWLISFSHRDVTIQGAELRVQKVYVSRQSSWLRSFDFRDY